MLVVFRVDASIQMGTGHVMRCLTLAKRLQSHLVNIVFICRELTGHLNDVIEAHGFHVIRLPRVDPIVKYESALTHAHWLETSLEMDAKQTLEYVSKALPDWLVVDHYALDGRWEKQMRPFVNKIMAIDDLADRIHDCDLLLDQNLYENMNKRYESLIPKFCKTFFGPRHALLRDEFYKYKKQLKVRDGVIRRILVFFGGSDPMDMTTRALHALLELNLIDVKIDVVVGASNPNKLTINKVCTDHPEFQYYCQINNMAELMARADLAIGAAGTATWERCFLGLPTITIILAQNQLQIAEEVEKQGAIWNLGSHDDVDSGKIAELIHSILHNPVALRQMSLNASALMGYEANDKDELLDALIKGNQKDEVI